MIRGILKENCTSAQHFLKADGSSQKRITGLSLQDLVYFKTQVRHERH